MNTVLDHLVVVAPSLAEGVHWCEHTLGVSPGAGGQHPLMGTHNRLLRIDAPGFAGAYLEIIAVEPGVRPERPPPQRRWFDMDDPALMAQVQATGPRLWHWVARTDALDAALGQCAAHGWARGPALQASRQSAQGLLQWRISVREDGQRLLDGVLPTLIEWGPLHPTAAMPASGVHLQGLRLQHPQAARLATWAAAVGLQGVEWREGPAALQAVLLPPRGEVHLGSPV